MAKAKREGDVVLETLARLRAAVAAHLRAGGPRASERDVLDWAAREIRADLRTHRARETRARKAAK